MVSSVPFRRSERLKCIQTNPPTKLQDCDSDIDSNSTMIEQEKKKLVRRKPGRPRKVIPEEIKCQLSKEKAMLVFQPKRRKSSDGYINHPIWRGSISVSLENFDVVDGLKACMSSRADVEILDAVQRLPMLVHGELVSREDVWPVAFHDSPPTDDIIDIYILPESERSENGLDSFLNAMTGKDVALKAVYDDVSILIFTSLQLTCPYLKTVGGKCYLWGVFEGKNPFFPRCHGENFFKMNFVDVPVLYCTDELQPVPTNQENRESMANNLLGEAEKHPFEGGAADSERPEQQNGAKGTFSIYKRPQSSDMEIGISESIGATILQMPKNFDDQTYGEETSSPFAVDLKYARTLCAILDKHGDITRDCVIRCNKTRISGLERICASVEDLKNKRFGDLRRSHLESMLSAITDAELMKLDVKWLRNKYEELLDAIERVKKYENMREKRKEMDKKVALRESLIAWKKDEIILKTEVEIQKLLSEVAEAKQEKQRLRSEMRKCKQLRHISLVDGLI
ncbi:hypothetical protein M5689_024142 [Euphorbia peplus]|nr:hypothetical protein M5689_024142 [Euphorbia peplus]